MFSIVEFSKEDPVSVQLVPSKWVNFTKDECKWPPGPATNLIKQCVDASSKWKTCEIKVLRTTGKKCLNIYKK